MTRLYRWWRLRHTETWEYRVRKLRGKWQTGTWRQVR